MPVFMSELPKNLKGLEYLGENPRNGVSLGIRLSFETQLHHDFVRWLLVEKLRVPCSEGPVRPDITLFLLDVFGDRAKWEPSVAILMFNFGVNIYFEQIVYRRPQS